VLDAFMRLVDKGIINLEELYAQKRAEIKQADQEAQEELARRVEEDKKIQAAQMQSEDVGCDTEDAVDDKKETSAEEKGGAE